MKSPFSKPSRFDAAIPKRVDINNDLVPLLTKRAELQAELALLRDEHFDVLELIRRDSNSAIETGGGLSKREAERAARVATLLGQPPAEGRTATLDERRRKIERRIRDICDALTLLRGRIDSEGRRASASVLDAIKDRHRALTAALCGKIAEAHQANCELHTLFDELEADDVWFECLWPSIPRFFGQPWDKSSPGACFVRGVRKAGLINTDAVPTEWRA